MSKTDKIITDYQDDFDFDPNFPEVTKDNLESHLWHLFAGFIDSNNDNFENSQMKILQAFVFFHNSSPEPVNHHYDYVLLIEGSTFNEYYVLKGKEKFYISDDGFSFKTFKCPLNAMRQFDNFTNNYKLHIKEVKK